MNQEEHILDLGLPNNPTSSSSATPIQSEEEDSDDDLTNMDFTQYSFWNLEYYIPYFNVNTTEVLERMSKPFLFFAQGREFLSFIKRGKKQADLWGPFWIVTTLIVVIVMTSNIGQFMNLRAIGAELEKDLGSSVSGNGTNSEGFQKISDNLLQWTTDFSLISVGATVFYAFALMVPGIMWAMMKYRSIQVSLMETICIYGYSFIVVIPPLMLCIADVTWLRWVLIILGFIYSALFVFSALFGEWKKAVTGPQDNFFLLIFAIFVFIAHLLLALFVKFYFYTFTVTIPTSQ